MIALVALCVGLGFYALKQRDGPSNRAQVTTATTTSISATAPASDAPDQTESFLKAFEASFAGPYVVSGVLEFLNDQAATRQQVRRARINDRSLDQIGGGAVVTREGELRRCSDDGTQFLCTEPEPEPTPSQRRSEMAADIAAEGGYDVIQRPDGCFVLTAKGDGTFSPLGFETTYCFDVETGAVKSKVTVKGRRTESFIADEIGSDVTEDDLTPK